jgi:hypothetical protein
MIRLVTVLVIALLPPAAAFAQSGGKAAPDVRAADSLGAAASAAPPAAPAAAGARAGRPRKVYYGGSLGLILGDYTRVSVQPMVGYNVTPKVSAGGRVVYEYVRDKRYTETYDSHNYGFSTFGRYRFVPELYGHAEFAATSYDLHSATGASERDWVPFLYLGGGYTQRIGKSISTYAEILVDVWQDDSSPYDDWAPLYNFGIGVGF